MKQQIGKILAGLAVILLLGSIQSMVVRADVVAEQVEVTDEERYESMYYVPLTETDGIDATGATVSSKTFEEEIVEKLSKHASKIDVSKYRLNSTQMKTDYFRVLYHHAELFYVDSAYTAWSMGNYIITIEPKYIMSEKEADAALEQIEMAADEALESVSSEMEDYEKALAVHDWLAVYCSYDYENYIASDVPEESHTAYGAFVNKTAVCDGYSKAYQYIMQNKLGISCMVVSSETIGHAWNLIQIGEKYYHVDVTWDDPVWDSIGRVKHDNFLLSDVGITATGHRGWDMYAEASDTAFENAVWKNSDSSMIYDSGNWYYIKNAAGNLVKTDDLLNVEETVLYRIGNNIWTANNQGSYYAGAFSCLQKYYDTLIFNGPKEIYSLKLKTNEVSILYMPTEDELPADTNMAVYNIYGLKVAEDMLYYAIQPMLNLSGSQSSYIKSIPIPGDELFGNVSIEGTVRYGSILKVNAALESENTGTITCQWYRSGIKILGAVSDTYQITAEDIGNVLMVSIRQEGAIGSLTAKTPVVGKAIPDMPETLSVLNGAAGNTLSSVILPTYYIWAEPDMQMTEIGEKNYLAYYCPDSTLYENFEIMITVNVSCISHNWNTGTVIKKPTCTAAGQKICTCIYCGETETQRLDATGHLHTEGRNAIEATCVMTGYTGDIYCIDCGRLLAEGSNTAVSGHTWISEGIIKEATATERGMISYVCSVCGGHKTETVEAKGAPAKGTVITIGTMVYKVTKAGSSGGTVSFIKNTNAKVKTVTIPATVAAEGITYKVTSIEAKALKNYKKLQKVVIGANVQSIGKEAFYGCKNLKNLTVKSEKLKTVGKNAVKSIKKNAVLHCPSKKLKTYKKLFNGKTGYLKTMKIEK